MNLKPARSQAQDLSYIADLDQFVSRSVGFTLNGKTHVLKEINNYDAISMEIARVTLVQMMRDDDEGQLPTTEEKLNLYYRMIHPVVPDLTREEIGNLNMNQMNMIMGLIERFFKGDPTLYEGIKKKLPTPKRNLFQILLSKFIMQRS